MSWFRGGVVCVHSICLKKNKLCNSALCDISQFFQVYKIPGHTNGY